MANIDPEFKKRMIAAIQNTGKSFDQLRDSAKNTSVYLHDLAFELDEKSKKKCKNIASQAIEQAKKQR